MLNRFSLCALAAIGCVFGAEEKLVIGTFPQEGFFSSFVSVVSLLMWADDNHKTPIVKWDARSLLYQREGYNGSKNPWEYYFEPVSDASCEAGEKSWDMCQTPDGFHLFASFLNNREVFNSETKFRAKEIIDKYVKIKPSIQEKIDQFYQSKMANRINIGIHMRGTDSHPNHKVVDGIAKETLEAAQDAIKRYPGKTVQFFVATDEQALLELAQKKLKAPVIYYDSTRSVDGKPLHKGSKNKALIGEETLIDGVLLSKCDFFIHSHSSVPIAVMAMNPQLETEFIAPWPWICKYVYGVDVPEKKRN